MNHLNLSRYEGEWLSFAQTVEAEGGKKVLSCYQCGKCSAGCPLSFAMEQQPHQVMRMVQLGLSDRALQSPTIWRCAGCFTCTTRCPRGVDIAGVMSALRVIALARNVRTSRRAQAFHKVFLSLIKRYGRINEFELVVRYKLASMNLFQDLDLGLRMFMQGKLKPPRGIAGVRQVRALFRHEKGGGKRSGLRLLPGLQLTRHREGV